MTGGSSAQGSGILSRASELERLQQDRGAAQRKRQQAQEMLSTTRRAAEKLQYELQMAQDDLEAVRRDQAALEAEERTVRNSNGQFAVLLEAIDGDSEARKNAVAAAERQTEGFRQKLQEKLQQKEAIHQEVETEKECIRRISNEKLELEGKRTRADKQAQQQKKISSDQEEKQIIDKLWDSYELSHSAAEALRQPVENLQKANSEIAGLRRQMRDLGNPNLGAIEEYERVNARYTFLTGQRDDVEKARTELKGIIRDITTEMEKIFTQRFREIDESFRGTFRELFGGGKAALVLEDEEHVLDCGIDIRVQPPGKAVSTISLLSGGEKAFVAIALYFAILKVRPTPFCVMDEIEAALDEENVNRCAQYMRKFSDKTQFLVSAHRRGTMEEADLLYGVTMQEKGISTVLTLDLEEARKTIED